MSAQVPFIDREAELAQIERLISEWGTRRVICVGAHGGIGKTRLLQEIRNRYLLSTPSFSSDRVKKQDIRIAVVLEFTTVQEWFGQFVAGAREMAAELGVELIETYADFDLDKMAADLESVILKSPDAVIINHGSSEKLRPGIELAIKQGIKVLTFDNDLRRIDGLTTRVTQDDYEGARLSLGKLAEDMDFQGKIAIIWRQDLAPLKKRKSILDNLLLKHPDIELVTEYGSTGANIIEDIYHQTKDILHSHPDIQAIWATWDEFAKGAFRALIEEGRTDISLYSFDLNPSDTELMLQPGSCWKATVAADAAEIGRVMVRLAMQAAYGIEIRRYYSLPMRLITQDVLRRSVVSRKPIWDESDIGQTPWLRSFRAGVEPRQHLLVTDIIDFDEQTHHVPLNVLIRLAQMLNERLNEEVFATYLSAILDLRKMEEANVSAERLNQEGLATNRVFVDCFNTVSTQHRVVLFHDTTDAVTRRGFWNRYLGLNSNLRTAYC